jgi:hypothetical protein
MLDGELEIQGTKSVTGWKMKGDKSVVSELEMFQ